MGMTTNSSKTMGYCRENEKIFKKVPDQRQRVTVWKPFTIKGAFRIKPAMISRLVGRDFANCRKTEVLEVKDKDKDGNTVVHKIKRKTFDNYVHYQQKNAWMTSAIYTLEIQRLSYYCQEYCPNEVFDLGKNQNLFHRYW